MSADSEYPLSQQSIFSVNVYSHLQFWADFFFCNWSMGIKQFSLRNRSPEYNTGVLIWHREQKGFNASSDVKYCSTEQEFGWSQEVRLLSHEKGNPFILQISQTQIKYVIETLNLKEHCFSLSIGATVTFLAALSLIVFWELVPLKNVIFVGHSMLMLYI